MLQHLLTGATSEVQTSRITSDITSPPRFDMTKLCNQTLLQSTFAETLHLYVSVCVTRRPEFAEAQILDYRIPKDKLIVISTALAHMDKRNWNLGPMEKHPVEIFWAEGFLTYNNPSARQKSPASSSPISTSLLPPAQMAPCLTRRSRNSRSTDMQTPGTPSAAGFTNILDDTG